MKKLKLKTAGYRQLEKEFTQWLELLGYAKSTLVTLPTHLREFFYWLEQQQITRIHAVNGPKAKAFIFQLSERANQRQGGGLSHGHLNKYIQALKLFSRYIRETGQGSFTVDLNQLAAERPYLDGRRQILTTREIKALYQACDYTPYTPVALRDKAMLGVFYGCGLRRSEGHHLDVSDILLEKEMLYVRKGKNYRERYVPVSQKVQADFENYLYEGRPCLLWGCGETEAFFITEKGQRRLGADGLLKRLQAIHSKVHDEQLKDKPVGLHTLRHSIATHLLVAGMKLQDIATFLGHKHLDSTQIYTHLAHENVL